MQVIYRLISPSGSVYIGQTKSIKSRMANYKSMCNKSQPRLYLSLKKHGFENHELYIIHKFPVGTDQSVVDNYEIYAIKWHKHVLRLSMLNLAEGGGGSAHHRRPAQPRSREDIQGEKHKLAKLTNDTATAIRNEYRWGVRGSGIPALAKKYNVSKRLIWHVVNNQGWNHLQPCPDSRDRERHAKLTPQQIVEIREKYVPWKYSTRALAREYGVDHKVINKIVNRKAYRGVA